MRTAAYPVSVVRRGHGARIVKGRALLGCRCGRCERALLSTAFITYHATASPAQRGGSGCGELWSWEPARKAKRAESREGTAPLVLHTPPTIHSPQSTVSARKRSSAASLASATLFVVSAHSTSPLHPLADHHQQCTATQHSSEHIHGAAVERRDEGRVEPLLPPSTSASSPPVTPHALAESSPLSHTLTLSVGAALDSAHTSLALLSSASTHSASAFLPSSIRAPSLPGSSSPPFSTSSLRAASPLPSPILSSELPHASGMSKRKQAKRKADKKAKEEKEVVNGGSNGAGGLVATLKEQGTVAFQEKRYEEAVRLFTQAISEDSSNAILFSNRSACYSANFQFDEACRDAEEAISLAPTWSKGYLRKGQALEGLMQLQRAYESYKEGQARDESDAVIKRSLDELVALMEDMKLTAKEAKLTLNPEEDRFDAMIAWLREGQAQFPYLYLQYYDEDYRGVHALTKVPNNRIILEVPLSHIMTSDVAKASEVGQKIIKSGCELNSTHSYLASYLLQEKHNPNSFWKPYIRILPQHYKNMPIFFDGPDLDLLKGSFAIRKIIDRQEELKEEFENICRHVPEFRTFGLDEFIWSAAAHPLQRFLFLQPPLLTALVLYCVMWALVWGFGGVQGSTGGDHAHLWFGSEQQQDGRVGADG